MTYNSIIFEKILRGWVDVMLINDNEMSSLHFVKEIVSITLTTGITYPRLWFAVF